MNQEEYLDRLIERREHGVEQVPVMNDEVAASLAAAEVLAHLQKIDVPPEFAGHLELSIRARARSFSRQNRSIVAGVRQRSPAGSRRFTIRRVLIAVLANVAVLTVACVSILTASASSLPGDPLYGLKQAEYQLTLTFAGDPQDRASIQIDQLHSALADLSAIVNAGRTDDAIRLALHFVATKTNESRGAVADLPAGPAREAAQRALDSALAEEEQTLRHLLDRVDWPMRVAFTQQMGALGDTVPTVTHATILPQSNSLLLIILTGTHFAPQAGFIIDGQAEGTVSKITSGELVAVISRFAWSPGEHALGVRNPDGTAAQLLLDWGYQHAPDQQGTPEHERGDGGGE